MSPSQKKGYGVILDLPDERDYFAEHILGDTAPISLPESVDLRNVSPYDQGSTNHCTSYALTMIHSIQNTKEFQRSVNLNPEEQWNNQKTYPGTAEESQGDYLQSALQSLNKFGLDHENKKLHIEGYARVNRTELDKWLAQGFVVYTGCMTNSATFYNAGKTGIINLRDTNQSFGGHAWAIVGYKTENGKKYYIAINSWGEDWGKFNDGSFLVPAEDIQLIYTPYMVYDTKDAPAQNEMIYKDVSENSWFGDVVKRATESGLVHGYDDGTFRPNNPMTRAEMLTVLDRFAKLNNLQF